MQTRDSNTHLPLEGIEGGDIGPKFGYNSKENGFLRFTNVRIPRRHLLMKFVEVDKEGNFSVRGDLRILYSVMIVIRTFIVNDAGFSLGKALTVATRYAVIRR